VKLIIQGVSEQFLQIYSDCSEVKEGKFKTDNMWSERILHTEIGLDSAAGKESKPEELTSDIGTFLFSFFLRFTICSLVKIVCIILIIYFFKLIHISSSKKRPPTAGTAETHHVLAHTQKLCVLNSSTS